MLRLGLTLILSGTVPCRRWAFTGLKERGTEQMAPANFGVQIRRRPIDAALALHHRSWAFTDLEESATKQTAFGLLRAILGRKLVLPEVYDLMTRVQELVVQSQASQVR